jgi:hypothetical protein
MALALYINGEAAPRYTFTPAQVQVAVTSILISAAHVFERACRYKIACRTRLEMMNDLDAFSSGNNSGTAQLRFEDVVMKWRNLKYSSFIEKFV